MSALEDAVKNATNFIKPLLIGGFAHEIEQGERWITQCLDASPSASTSSCVSNKAAIVKQALSLLRNIHEADRTSQADSPYDGTLVGIVYGLIDLIILQGVLPSLTAGVTFPQRPRSVLIPAASRSTPRNYSLLAEVVRSLHGILREKNVGLEPLVSQRALPDVVSGAAELTFSPQVVQKMRTSPNDRSQFQEIIDSTYTSRLLPLLTTYLQQSLPTWLRNQLSTLLSLVPLRIQGVRHTIEFICLSYTGSGTQTQEQTHSRSKGAPVPLEAISQASRLLLSVPSSTTSDAWFTQLAPQLWDLLDGEGGPELGKAAGYIIASILNRRSTGAPGQIGWKLFAEPLLNAIRPYVADSLTAVTRTSKSQGLEKAIVTEADLKLSLHRLATIASAYSHPGLLKRLVRPLILPLWGLLGYAKSRSLGSKTGISYLNPQWVRLPWTILLRYVQTSTDPEPLYEISRSLFWDGGANWCYGPGAEGGIEIRSRTRHEVDVDDTSNMLNQLQELDQRVEWFVTLLSDANIDGNDAGIIFLNLTRRWLSRNDKGKDKKSLLHDGETNPFQTLVHAKLAEAVAQRFQDKIARQPQHVVELTKELLHDFVEEHKSSSKSRESSNKVSYATLSNLTVTQPDSIENLDSNVEDLVSFSLSILYILLTSADFNRTSETNALLSSLMPSLHYLTAKHKFIAISSIIANSANTLISVISPSTPANSSASNENSHVASPNKLRSILSEITTGEPPNRAWALTELRSFIVDCKTFPIVDVPSTTHLILSASIADADSFVFTAGISVLVALTTQAARPVVRILVDTFVDVDENTLSRQTDKVSTSALDFRLRIGEVLNSFVEEENFWTSSSKAFGRERVLSTIVEAMLLLSSRRGQRVKTLTKRNEIAAREDRKRIEGEQAWGGEIPSLFPDEVEDTPLQQKESEALQKVVAGWQNTGLEEDIRIRTSALSIIGYILERRLAFIQGSMVDAATQIVLATLSMERTPEKVILRRAAVLVLMGLLKGMDTLLEERKETKVDLEPDQWAEVERVVKWTENEDRDGLVREHAANVIEALETWRMKKVFGVRPEGIVEASRLELGERLRGLRINPPVSEESARQRGRIVEEIE